MSKIIEEVSPCKNCVNESIDKRLCLDNCPRLRAYQAGNADYKKKEVFTVPDKDLVEDIESNNFIETDTSSEIDSFREIEEDLEEETTDEAKKPSPVKHIRPNPSWEKAMPVKKKKPVQTCAICGKERAPGDKFPRGVCASPCYMSWFRGSIVHPVLGAFKKMPKNELSTGMKAIKYQGEGEPPTEDLVSVELDLEPYPVISEEICRIAERLSLPISHIIISLIGEALAARREGGL